MKLGVVVADGEDIQVDKWLIEPTSGDDRIVGISPLLERVIGLETNCVLVRYIQFAPLTGRHSRESGTVRISGM